MKSSVSVIIPCKDRPQQLLRALASVREQTVLPDEVIVVDDGSEPPLSLDSGGPVPVKLIRQINLGPSAARNRGIQEAAGDWIALLDSDDTWLADKLETQLSLISRYEGAGFCVCDMVVHGRSAVAEFPFVPSDGAPDGLIEDALERLLPGHYIHTSGVMFRKDVFTAVGGFDESLWYCEDRDLWLRLAAATEVVATTRRLSEYFREGESLSVHENSTVESIVAIYILDKMIESDLFDRLIKEQAIALKGEVLYGLSYWYRKEGHPFKCCRNAFASLRGGGPVAPNLKNLFYCWPELLLGGLSRMLARRPQTVKNDAWVRAISK